MKRSFRTATFSRWMKKSNVTDTDLRQSVIEMEHGLIDAQLGGLLEICHDDQDEDKQTP